LVGRGVWGETKPNNPKGSGETRKPGETEPHKPVSQGKGVWGIKACKQLEGYQTPWLTSLLGRRTMVGFGKPNPVNPQTLKHRF